jgi:hypothetical protein
MLQFSASGVILPSAFRLPRKGSFVKLRLSDIQLANRRKMTLPTGSWLCSFKGGM